MELGVKIRSAQASRSCSQSQVCAARHVLTRAAAFMLRARGNSGVALFALHSFAFDRLHLGCRLRWLERGEVERREFKAPLDFARAKDREGENDPDGARV